MSSVTNQRGITTPRKKNTTTSERDTNGSIKSESHSKATDGQEKEHGQDKRTLTNQKGLGLKDILKSESEEPVAGPNLTCPGPEKQQVACNMKDCPGRQSVTPLPSKNYERSFLFLRARLLVPVGRCGTLLGDLWIREEN